MFTKDKAFYFVTCYNIITPWLNWVVIQLY